MLTISNDDLVAKVKRLVQDERKITLEILNHINEIERRRLYAELGFPSMFAWLTKGLGYSEPAAGRRISSARLLKTMPTIADKIESGVVNLSTLAQAQTVIRAEEKRVGERMPIEMKSDVLAKIESCSARESERNLATMFPGLSATRDVVRTVNENAVRAHVTFTAAQMGKIERAAQLFSHKIIDGNLADILEAALDELIARKDPLVKIVKPRVRTIVPPPSMTQSFADVGVNLEEETCVTVRNEKAISPSTRNAVFQRDDGSCVFLNNAGSACGSRHRVQVDHIIPRAKGGTNDISNLRLLCQTHNLLMAERSFGESQMGKFLANRNG